MSPARGNPCARSGARGAGLRQAHASTRLALAIALGVAVRPASAGELASEVDSALRRGAAWLATQQGVDGAWHSRAYGQMRGGAGNSALALYALAQAPPEIAHPHADALRRGMEVLTANLDPAGFIRGPDGSSDYPNYATALAASALVAQASPRGVGDRVGAADAVVAPRLTRMSVYLARAQQRMALPWEPAGVPLGGWSLIGGDPDDPASFRDVNLSTTRLALEGLGAAATRTAAGATLQEARRQALPYVRALQNRDGGFRFAGVADDPLNKAGLVRSGVAAAGPSSAAADRPADEARSYGSATADGLAALAACDVGSADRAFQAAVAWLDAHPGVDHVPGFEEQAGGPPSARHGLVFYYRASLARAMRLASDARFARQHVPLAESLVAEQRADGSWANASALMREDDPLIATAWALCALSQVRPLVLQQDR